MSMVVFSSVPFRWVAIPSTRISIDSSVFASYVLPPLVCYFVAALLVVTPKTHAFRIALWPVVALLAFRAAVSVDMSFGNPQLNCINSDWVLCMLFIATRSLDWALATQPLVRYLRPANSSPSTIMDAFDLAFNLRGHGWRLSHATYIPRETRPGNRIAFVLHASLSAAAHALICEVFHRVVLSFVPGRVGGVSGPASIYDETLPFLVRHFRASIIATCNAVGLYAAIQMFYDTCTVLGILLFGTGPAQWPPAFNAPWRATSLADLWGRRWHQWYRHVVVLLGGYPLSLVFGRAGIVVGAFLASAVIHQIVLLELDAQAEFWRMLVGFGMMALGILAERVFQLVVGRKVGGLVGWIWTMGWLLLWGNVIVEGFTRAGLFDRPSLIGGTLPVGALVEQLVIDFDTWLHGI